MSTVLYPGTFNPIHNGHADLVQRASILFDRVVLGIATSPQKDPSVLALRVELAEKALAHLSNVEVRGFNTLTVDFAKEVGAGVILKGIRTVTDFEYEFQMLNMNRVLAPGLETIFLAPSEAYSYILIKAMSAVLYILLSLRPSRKASSVNADRPGNTPWLDP